jgi:RNA polymerase sigma factor (sigma-70 family)
MPGPLALPPIASHVLRVPEDRGSGAPEAPLGTASSLEWCAVAAIAPKESILPDGPHTPDARTVAVLTTGLRLIALRALSNADDADDVVQETLARGLSAMADDRIQNHEQIGAYFRGILRHVITDLMRDHGKTVSLDLMADPPAANSHVDALAALISSEDSARVVRALQALPQRSRECLRLGFYEGLSPAQIGERLHEPASRVRKRRSRALQLLRAAFFGQKSATSTLDLARSDGHNSGSSATYIEEMPPPTVRGNGATSIDRRNVDDR